MKSAVIQAPIQIQWLLTWHMKGAAYKEQEQTYNQYFANRRQLRFEEEKTIEQQQFCDRSEIGLVHNLLFD